MARVTERPARDEVRFIGTAEPDRAVTVQAEVAGRVARAEEIAISILAAEPKKCSTTSSLQINFGWLSKSGAKSFVATLGARLCDASFPIPRL